MKMTHEKVIQLSHRVMGAIEDLDEVEIFEEPNTIRQEIVKILTGLLHDEEKVDETVRLKITSQKRTIPEGGAEWRWVLGGAERMPRAGLYWLRVRDRDGRAADARVVVAP